MLSEQMIDFRVLGPLEFRADGRVFELGRPQQCVVLAALLVDAGRLVPVDVLVERVWGSAPPERARRILHTHIARIRRILEQATGEIEDAHALSLVRRPGGYLLELNTSGVDAHRFLELVENARDPRCSDRDRVGLLREALGLWRGEALAGLPGEWCERMREGWARQRLDAVVAWAHAELAVGNSEAVIEPVGQLSSSHPLHEPLAAVWIGALHAAGRSAEALDRYEAVRSRLADELGADPSAELQTLHQGILRGDVMEVPGTPRRSAGMVPAQLPAGVPSFAGRRDVLDALDAMLAPDSDQSPAVVISALAGTAGVGKTALAVHWARQVAGQFPDGQLYVNLRGFDPHGPAMEPAEALRGFLDALAVPPQRIPASLDAQAGLYRSLVADRRMLLILDDARDAAQVRPLLPAAPGCVVVVTSRNQLSSLVTAEGARPLSLDVLSHAEARQLLEGRLGAERLAAEPEATDEIITSCARLPLALAIVAARAATRPEFPLRELAAELREAQHGLDALSDPDPALDIRAAIDVSYRTLSTDAARLFRRLGLHPGPDVSVPAVASLAGIPRQQARLLLAELTQAHLLYEHKPGRYSFHDLLRSYAAELAHAADDQDDLQATRRRLLDHYLHTAFSATVLLDPHRIRVHLDPPEQGVEAEDLGDLESALAWFIRERPVLLAAIEQAKTNAFDNHVWQLAWTLGIFLQRQGHWHEQVGVQRAALAAGQRQGDRLAQGCAHADLGRVFIVMNRHADAQTHLQLALEQFRALANPTRQAHAHQNLAWMFGKQGRNREALGHVQQALDLYRIAGHRLGEAYAHNGAGWYHAQMGDYLDALAYCQQAVTLLEELDDRPGQTYSWDSLGYIHRGLGDHQQALACYGHAFNLARDLGDRYQEAEILTHLGDTHHAAGDLDAAREAWCRALTLLEELDHTDADGVRGRLEQLGSITLDTCHTS